MAGWNRLKSLLIPYLSLKIWEELDGQIKDREKDSIKMQK